MSWSEGSEIMSMIIKSIKEKIDSEDKEEIYREFIQYFEDNDCDTLEECLGEDNVFDRAYEEVSKIYEYENQTIEEEWDDQDRDRF
jgi:hypothetical protein